MKNVFGRNCFFADPALSEGDIFRNTTVEMMGDHNHIESFFKRIYRIWSCRACRRWNDVCLAADLDDVWGVSAAGSFCMKSVNRSAFKGRNCIFDKAAFVQRVGMDKNLHVEVVSNR